MKSPKWVQEVKWLRCISTNDLFEKYMLPNILKDEDHSKYLILNKITPYFDRLQKHNSSDELFLLSMVVNLLIAVQIYIDGGGRKDIKSMRDKLNKAANLAEDLANALREIEAYREDSFVFAFPSSLGRLLEMQSYFRAAEDNDDTPSDDNILEAETLLKNMADNLRDTKVGTPTLEWIDDHNSQTDEINVVTRALERHANPPNGIIAAFIFLCFGIEVEESTIQKFNSPSRKKHYKPDIRHIEIRR